MPHPNASALEFLLTRRSRPAKTLGLPVPSKAELEPLLRAAARTPDHGKLEPWRFVVLGPEALASFGPAVAEAGQRLAIEPEKIDKQALQFASAACVVAVIAAPVPSDKVPQIEQLYSAGAVCLALVNAALAAGWGANWLSGWASHDPKFCADTLGLGPDEKIAGFIHIGTETSTPPERPRPDLNVKVDWRP